ncbi:MAG TPA: DUF6221 family protein, partial [Gemmatimonadaceae bacterium]|nr:DUF6221 family protein [Gemmatimonadaceae bacterium]
MDLHAVLLARIEELERIAKAVPYLAARMWDNGRAGVGAVKARQHWTDEARVLIEEHAHLHGPAAVLRGLAEDRDILRRHTAGRWPSVEDGYDAPTCIGCGRDDTGDPRYLVPCPEIESLARRLG